MYKTYATKLSEVEPVWFVVDASGLTLGRLSTRIAVVLRGKHKPMFSPSLDTGDFVVVINAEKVVVTGDRLDQKKYYRHSLYLGGLKEITLRRLLETHPERAIEMAVRGMLPKTPLGRQMMQKLKIYCGGEHPHAAQQPTAMPA
ncbi:50S ribosomal protein L13 [Anaerolineaceae bacterium]|nr:50S ribosomal protein L13 [Anaerolineaceae bacterium]